MTDITIGIAWLVCTVVILTLYHSIFKVYYFSVQGCLTEIVVCGFIGLVVSLFGLAIIIEHWKIIIGVVIVFIVLKSILGSR